MVVVAETAIVSEPAANSAPISCHKFSLEGSSRPLDPTACDEGKEFSGCLDYVGLR